MAIKNPFGYPKNLNNTVIMKDYIFANNTSSLLQKSWLIFIFKKKYILDLALLVLTIIAISLIVWDNLILKNQKFIFDKMRSSNSLISNLGRFRGRIPWLV